MEQERDYAQEAEDRSRKTIQEFANAVNISNFDKKAFQDEFCREHRTLQQSMFREILGLICMMSKEDYRTDGRNEGSQIMAKKLIAGYAEIYKQEEIERLKMDGFSIERATERAEKDAKMIIESPEIYLGLRYI